PIRGDFGLPDARIIKPGDPYGSTLYYRMSKFGRDRMPHLGSDWPDEIGLGIVEAWITGLNGGVPRAKPIAEVEVTEQALADPKIAMILARRLGRGQLKPAEREQLLAIAVKLPAGPVRELFEGYLPSDGQKLGSNPRPRAILALKGDAGRGEKLFWSQTVNCGTCHKIGDRGVVLGPDLTTIG